MRILALVIGFSFALSACGGKRPLLEDLSGKQNLAYFKLHSLRGVRDGDRLEAQAVLSDSSSILALEMHFQVGSPTTLQSGTWRWTRRDAELTGSIRGKSVTFLGGQDGPPSIGGSFELLDASGSPAYKVNLPVAELKTHGS